MIAVVILRLGGLVRLETYLRMSLKTFIKDSTGSGHPVIRLYCADRIDYLQIATNLTLLDQIMSCRAG